MTKIDAIKNGLATAPYFALSPRMIAKLRETPVSPKPAPKDDQKSA